MTREAWGDTALEEGEEREFQFGSLALTVRREGREFRTRRTLAGEERAVASPSLLRGDDGWKRWVFAKASKTMRLSPRVDARSIVVAPRDQFHLMRGAEATVFVVLPLWVGIEDAASGQTMATLPTRSMGRGWFGSRTMGEVCFWHQSRFFHEPPPRQEGGASVICTIHIANDSKGDLPVEKVCLRMRHFSLFWADGRYWTDEARLRFEGKDEGSEISYTGHPPPEAPLAELVRGPHERPGSVFSAKAFFNLFSIGGDQ
ncbi:MAG: hypothetical protein AUJ52_08095 [Elusimicrobia bacterium CG1_02_63_36]|nr:MAG: hypothetical protein AUJ52_08095 [Elusimicrobia bacterium CG1_02_63_36]